MVFRALGGATVVSQDTFDKVYEIVVASEIRHSDQYLALYQTAKSQGQRETAGLARDYVLSSIETLQTMAVEARRTKRFTVDLSEQIEDQTAKLRTAIE